MAGNDSMSKANSISCSLTEIIGSSHNVTPQKCKLTVDMRILTTKRTCDNVLEQLKGIIDRVAADKSVKAAYRIEDKTEPFEANHSSPLVLALCLFLHPRGL